LSNFKKKIKEVNDIYGEIGKDEEVLEELEEEISELKEAVEKENFRVFLSGKYDKNGAILEISSGAGGRDAEDFVALLLRMYQRYGERKNFKTKIISSSYGEAGGPEGRTGIKSISLEFKGEYAFGFLKTESGTHRLVRKSPFSSADLRHTSFAQVEVFPIINHNETCAEIKEEDIRIETYRSSGPGGQNVNKRESAIRIIHLPTNIVVTSQTERLQGENKKTAMSVLMGKLEKLNEEKREEEVKSAKGEIFGVSWGSQIRNYVFHPYKLVKDLRTQKETSNVEDVLDGNLDIFKK
jgi:peptide chain release factor 2